MSRWVLLDPGFGWLALLVPAALFLALRRSRPAIRFAPASLAAGAPPTSWRTRLLWLPRVLQGLGLLLVVLALARPATREAVPQTNDGVDILLCLDMSSSMQATDLDGRSTRLSVARREAMRFIEGRPNDRIGFLAFARYPDLRCPLTLDHGALVGILDEVSTVSPDGPEDATGIGAAVARGVQVLDAARARSPVLIVLTDGVENVALEGEADEIPPQHAGQLAERLGVRVHPIVVGSRNTKTKALERLAARTGGAFHRARDAGAMQRVYAEIDRLETAPVEIPRFVFLDRYVAVLVAGLVLIALGAVLGASVLGVLP